MGRKNFIGLFLIIAFGLFTEGVGYGELSQKSQEVSGSSEIDKTGEIRFQESYSKLPLYFIQNDGQVDEKVRFYEKGKGHATFFANDGVYLSMFTGQEFKSRPGHDMAEHAGPNANDPDERLEVIKLGLLDANKNPEITAVDQQEGRINYFIGNDPEKWKTNIPTYKGVVYKDVYKGIDIKFYGNNRQLEYDIIVKPGADPKDVKFSYEGIKDLRLTEGGDLEVILNKGSMYQKRPYVYQEIEGKRVEIKGDFVISSSHIEVDGVNEEDAKFSYGFEVASYDKNHPIIIDPRLVYSTYLGGTFADSGSDIAVDPYGNAYILGNTTSTDFPTASPIYGSNAGAPDVFVTKINASGTALVYSTYLGGSSFDEGNGIAVDATGNAYIVGNTSSSNFPTASSIDDTCGSCPTYFDAFVTKLDSIGTSLVYSRYYGGVTDEFGQDIAIDNSGNAYIIGTAWNAYVDWGVFGENHAYVTKFNPSGYTIDGLVLEGNSEDYGEGIAIDSMRNIYVIGYTGSNNLIERLYSPLVPPIQGKSGGSDAFVVKLNLKPYPDFDIVYYATYLGGSGDDRGNSIAVDTSGSAYITGRTKKPTCPSNIVCNFEDFPLVSPIDGYLDQDWPDGFVTKVNPDGTALVYSTFLGGSDDDEGRAIAVDPSGNAYITGATRSVDFPIASPIDGSCGGCPAKYDAFVSVIGAGGAGFVYSTYLGGIESDGGGGIAVDALRNAYITGWNSLGDFPTTAGVYDTSFNGATDAFVAKIEPVLDVGVSSTDERNPGVAYNSVNDQFLTVWENNGSIMGEIRRGDGSIVRDDFVIAPSYDSVFYHIFFTKPSVTYKSGQNRYFVVAHLEAWWRANALLPWNKQEEIGLRVLSTTGSSVLAGSLNITPGDIGEFGRPDVAAAINGLSCCILGVWSDYNIIRGRLINSDGTFPGSEFVIANAGSGTVATPAVAYQQSPNDDFLVVYKVIPVSGDPYIARRIVQPNGTVSSELIVSDAGTQLANPDVAFNESSGTYLVVWENGNITGQILDSSGNKIGGNLIINYPACRSVPLQGWVCRSIGEPAVAAYTDTNIFLVTYYKEPFPLCVFGETCDLDKDLRGGCVASNGSVGSFFDISYDLGLNDQNPALAYGPVVREFMVAWEHEKTAGSNFDVYGKLVENCNMNLAAYVSQSVPTEMTAGQSYDVSVTMKNTGTTTWFANDYDGYKLGSQNPEDNTTWGLQRVNVPNTVAPGQEVTFNFTVTAPTTPGAYNFQWRMVQERVAWFGEYTPNVSVTVTVLCGGKPATIVGTAGNDILSGTAGADVIHGLAGNDTIDGLGGNDVICGGTGTDTLNGGDGNDRLLGEGGRDTLNGGNGADRLVGGNGNDILNGNAGNDILQGGSGDDKLDGGTHVTGDSCDGGTHVIGDTAVNCETKIGIP